MRWSSLMSTSVFLFIWLFAHGSFVVTSLIMPCNIYNAKKTRLQRCNPVLFVTCTPTGNRTQIKGLGNLRSIH